MSTRFFKRTGLIWRNNFTLTVAILTMSQFVSHGTQAAGIGVLNPLGKRPPVVGVPLAERVIDLNGKTVWLITPRQTGSQIEEALVLVEVELKKRFPEVTIINNYKESTYSEDDPVLWDEMVAKADAFVYGAAPSASSTDYAMRWSGNLEKRGLPGAVLLYDTLVEIAENAVDNKGVPVRFVPVTYPPQNMELGVKAEAMERLVEALTASLTDEEKRAGSARVRWLAESRNMLRLMKP